MRKNLLVVSLLIAFTQSGWSATAEVQPHRAAGGMASEFKNHRFLPADSPIPLPQKTLTESDRRIIEQAELMFERNSTLSIVMVEKGQLVFEKYRAPSGPTIPNFSWSMSKSLTGYTVGAMSCSGQIPDLNQQGQSYSPELRNTVYGEATVKNLLTMSSGVKDAIHSGNQIYKTSGCTHGIDCDDWQMQRNQVLSGVELLKAFPDREISRGRPVASGSRFAYNAVDTLSLSNIADHNGGFINNFTKYIWSQAGAEAPAYWMLDKENRAISQAGFSAVSRDWARLAMLSIKQSKSSDCMGKFMQDATTEHLSNAGHRIGKAFKGYGYQTWIANFGPRDSYWWVGYGGQRVGVDPVTERIIVITSYREDYMKEVYGLFGTWQRQ
jgi:CubicO group peptidase (beta-lactamase class C family)